MQKVGKILWWDRRDKEGVISASDGSEFYFNASVFPEHSRSKSPEGRFVRFQVDNLVTHLQCAKRVSIIPSNGITKAKRTFERSKIDDSPESAA